MKHIAIFGFGVLSQEVMKRLRHSGHNLIFVGRDASEAASIEEQGIATHVIDFRNDDELKAIGIGRHINILFCFFPTDSDNVFLTISARALDKDLTIIATVDDPESAEKLLAAGANKIIDPYEICGRKLHEMLVRPEIVNMLDQTVFGQHDLNLAQIEIPLGANLENTKISGLALSETYNLILVGVVGKELGEELHFALGDKELHLAGGDMLVVLGVDADIASFKAAILQMPH